MTQSAILRCTAELRAQTDTLADIQQILEDEARARNINLSAHVCEAGSLREHVEPHGFLRTIERGRTALSWGVWFNLKQGGPTLSIHWKGREPEKNQAYLLSVRTMDIFRKQPPKIRCMRENERGMAEKVQAPYPPHIAVALAFMESQFWNSRPYRRLFRHVLTREVWRDYVPR